MFSVCVAAVKCRTVLHHCVVYFWSSWIMYCLLLMQTFLDLRGPLMAECTCRWTHHRHYYWQRLIHLCFNYSHKKWCEQKPQLKYVLPTIWRQIGLPSLSSNDKCISNILTPKPLNINVLLGDGLLRPGTRHLHQSASMFNSRTGFKEKHTNVLLHTNLWI